MQEHARFLFSRSDYSQANDLVKPGAFLPSNGETSVFVVDGLNGADIRAIGNNVGVQRGRPPKGRAELSERVVVAVGLEFMRDDIPPRHGNIVGWPPAGPEYKARSKAIVLELSAEARLVLR